MAYELTYTGVYNARTSNQIEIRIYRKDIVPDQVRTLSNKEIVSFATAYGSGADSKYQIINGLEATLVLRVLAGSHITTDTFVTELYDEWKVIAFCDGEYVFNGWIEPSEGTYAMKDTPIPIALKCTDGLGLLKSQELTDIDGSSLLNKTLTLAHYMQAALAKTGLTLHTNFICSVYESSMQSRYDDITADFFGQTYLDHQTFLNTSESFVNCYQALEILLGGAFMLYQWRDRWVVSYRPELLESIGPSYYYTEYDTNAVPIAGFLVDHSQVDVSFNSQQHPINKDATVSSQFPTRSVNTRYNYTPWPDIPKNSKFERGTFSLPLSGPNYRSYIIDEWTYGRFASFNSRFPFTPVAVNAYRKSTINAYQVEIERELVLPPNASTGLNIYLLSSPIPVGTNDRVKFEFEYRHQLGAANYGNRQLCRVYLYQPGNPTPLWMDGQGRWGGGAPGSITHFYDNGEDSSKYNGFTFESLPIPFDGTLYFLFTSTDIGGDMDFYRNFSIEYKPFINNGYLQVLGDRWLTVQNVNVKDTIETEVFISDSPKKAFKGALLRADGSLTTPTWRRLDIPESRHLKELYNLGQFNHYWRRMRKIQGTIRGIVCNPASAPTTFFPIAFHFHLRFVDNATDRYYVLVSPLSIDYKEGRFTAIAIECLKDGDVYQEGDTHEFNYIFK